MSEGVRCRHAQLASGCHYCANSTLRQRVAELEAEREELKAKVREDDFGAVSREDNPRCGLMTPLHAVAVLLLDASGHTWLARRSRAPFDGLRECPGGAVEAGETPWQAAVRRVRREAGLTVAEAALRSVGVAAFNTGAREVRCHLFMWHVPESTEPQDTEREARGPWAARALRPCMSDCTPATGALLALAPWVPREDGHE